MARFGFLSLLTFAFIALFTLGAGAACDPADSRIALNLPTASTTIAAPIDVLAIAASSCSITSIQVYLDGVLQWSQYRQTAVHVMLPAAIGKHLVVVKVWNSAGRSSMADAIVNVSNVHEDECQSPFPFDNFVWVCEPRVTLPTDSPVFLLGKVRSDTAPLRETRITFNGELWARAFGAAASRPMAHFMLPPALYMIDVASSNTAGTEMHNGGGVTVRSQVACQAPVVTLLYPKPSAGGPLGQPLSYFAAADGGRQCPVTSITVYVDGRAQYRAWGQSRISGRMWAPSGTHQVTVQAWNSRGQTGKRSVTVTAEQSEEPFCMPDTSPGVMLCGAEPLPIGPVVGIGTPINPAVPTTAGRIYVNGVKRADYYRDALLRSFMLVTLPPGSYTFTAVAWNAAGEVSTDTQVYTVEP
jgi:hypothetical protein